MVLSSNQELEQLVKFLTHQLAEALRRLEAYEEQEEQETKKEERPS